MSQGAGGVVAEGGGVEVGREVEVGIEMVFVYQYSNNVSSSNSSRASICVWKEGEEGVGGEI